MKQVIIGNNVFWYCAILVLIGLGGCSSGISVTNTRMSSPLTSVLNEEQQNRFDYFFLEAERLKSKEDYTAAFEMFRHCEVIDPYSAEVKSSLAPFYFSLGDDSIGIEYQKRAVELAPDNYWYAAELAGMYESRKDYVSAIQIYEKMIKQFPKKDDPFYELLELYPRNGDYEKAVKLLDDLEKHQGKSEELSMRKFQLYLYQEKTKEAFLELESLVKEYPNEMRYRYVLGDLYLAHQRYPEALQIYREILSEDPGNEQVMLSMTEYYDAMGDTAAYRNQVDSVLFNQMISDEAKGQLMRQIIMKSETGAIDTIQVVSLFDRLIATEPIDGDLLMLYAQYLLSKNMNQKASPVLEKILEIDPSNSLVRRQLLSEAIRSSNSQRVVDLCIPVTEGAPEDPEDFAFYYYLAASYYQLNNYESALHTIEKALSFVAEDTKPEVISDFYAMRGDLYHLQKKETEAYASYDSSLVYNPSNIGTLNNYAYYLSERKDGDLVKAERMSLKTVEKEPNNDTYLDTYAWILYRLGRYEEAKTYVDRALQNGGAENGVELDHAGDIYFKLELKKEAIDFWKQALEKEIENPEKVERKIKQAE